MNSKQNFTTLLFSFFILCVVALSSCSSTKNISSAPKTSAAKPLTTEDLYKNKVVAQASTSQFLTSKMKINLAMGDKDISLGGSLRMKRGEVIQLSMTFPIVGEVCRMEFAPSEVLIIDRINTRYVKVPYEKVDFLKSANLDFNVLESIFWNELFYPGVADVKTRLSEFTIGTAGARTLLSLATAPQLDYAFLTNTASAQIERTTVSPKNTDNKDNLVCAYSNFVKFGTGSFPASIKITFAGSSQTYGLDISLSSIGAQTDWSTHTEVSSKYKLMDVEKLLKSLVP